MSDEAFTRAALYALGALPSDEAVAFEEEVRQAPPRLREAASALRAVAGALGLAAPPAPPSAAVRERLLARIAGERGSEAAPPAPDLSFVLDRDVAWQDLGRGAAIKVFERDPARRTATYLLRLAPGGELASHGHDVVEHCYVVRGDIRAGDRHIHAGDYHRAGIGSTHRALASDGGCVVLIVEAPV